MEKEELIKFLNESMNELKDKNFEVRKNLDNIPFEIESDDIKKSKLLVKLISVFGLVQFVNLLNSMDENKGILFNSLVFIYIALSFKTAVGEMQTCDMVMDYKQMMEKNMSENSKKISNMQTSIEFLQSLTKEEEKYLNLKM